MLLIIFSLFNGYVFLVSENGDRGESSFPKMLGSIETNDRFFDRSFLLFFFFFLFENVWRKIDLRLKEPINLLRRLAH